jgi:hypothetical protein
MMKTTIPQCAPAVFWGVMLTVLSLQSPQLAQAAGLPVERAKEFAPRGEGSVIASGAVEDTLKACIARIPDAASAGQRLLAEQNCAGEDLTRKTSRSAPKF